MKVVLKISEILVAVFLEKQYFIFWKQSFVRLAIAIHHVTSTWPISTQHCETSFKYSCFLRILLCIYDISACFVPNSVKRNRFGVLQLTRTQKFMLNSTRCILMSATKLFNDWLEGTDLTNNRSCQLELVRPRWILCVKEDWRQVKTSVRHARPSISFSKTTQPQKDHRCDILCKVLTYMT